EDERDACVREGVHRGTRGLSGEGAAIEQAAVEIGEDDERRRHALSGSTAATRRSKMSGSAARTRFQLGMSGWPTGSSRYASEARRMARAKASTACPSSWAANQTQLIWASLY